jgi:multidrug efflux pump subunit AcrA (membrane-fusion protein)
LQLEASQQAAAAEASVLSAQLQEARASASAAASKARGDQLVLAKEIKRLREELAAAKQVGRPDSKVFSDQTRLDQIRPDPGFKVAAAGAMCVDSSTMVSTSIVCSEVYMWACKMQSRHPSVQLLGHQFSLMVVHKCACHEGRSHTCEDTLYLNSLPVGA